MSTVLAKQPKRVICEVIVDHDTTAAPRHWATLPGRGDTLRVYTRSGRLVVVLTSGGVEQRFYIPLDRIRGWNISSSPA